MCQYKLLGGDRLVNEGAASLLTLAGKIKSGVKLPSLTQSQM